MFKLIKDSYQMYFKSFPIILLFAAPLLVLSGISVWIENADTLNRGMLYFHYAALVLIPLVSIATDISLYRRFFGYSIINPLSSIKTFALYLVTQLALGLVASAPIILFRHILTSLGVPDLAAFITAIAVNTFLGIYLLARFSILFPLMIQNKVPSLKEFSQYTARPYKDWMAVAVLIYIPYVLFYYLIACPMLNMLIVNMFAFVFVCFNIKYVSAFRVPTAKTSTARDSAVRISEPVVAEPAPRKAPKPAVRKTAAKKSEAVKKETAAPKKPAPKKAAPKATTKKVK